MKSNKWKFLLTGAATLTFTDSLTQASSQSATKAILHKLPLLLLQKNKTNNSNYFTDRTRTALMDES